MPAIRRGTCFRITGGLFRWELFYATIPWMNFPSCSISSRGTAVGCFSRTLPHGTLLRPPRIDRNGPGVRKKRYSVLQAVVLRPCLYPECISVHGYQDRFPNHCPDYNPQGCPAVQGRFPEYHGQHPDQERSFRARGVSVRTGGILTCPYPV